MDGAPDEQTKQFIEWFGALLLLFVTLGGQAWQYIKKFNKPEDKELTYGALEVADMTPMRSLVKKLDEVLEMKADLHHMLESNEKIRELLDKIDRADEIERNVQARLRDNHRRT